MTGLLEWDICPHTKASSANPFSRFRREYRIEPTKDGNWRYWVFDRESYAGTRGTEAAAKAACEAHFLDRLRGVPAVKALADTLVSIERALDDEDRGFPNKLLTIREILSDCFSGSLEEFEKAVDETHGESEHGQQYRLLIEFIRLRAASWSPVRESEVA